MNKQDYEELKARIGAKRVEQLRHYWFEETDDADTQYWRDDLTDDEERLIDEWERPFYQGLAKLCEEALEAEKAFHVAKTVQ